MAEITNQLLKDALADAEVVRQTAIANAKIALEETFTPQIKAMLARKLRAETAKEEPFQNADPVGGAGPEDTSALGGTENKQPSADANDSSGIDQGGEGAGTAKTDWYNDWNESDFDLDEVIKELEADVANLSEGHDEEDEDEDEDEGGEEDSEGGMEDKGGEEKPEAPFAKKDENPFAKKEDESKADFGEKETDKMAKAGDDTGEKTPAIDPKLVSIGPEADKGAEPMPGSTEGGEDKGEEELDLESILQELDMEEQARAAKESQMATEMSKLRNQLSQYKTVVDRMRESLQEVNLLNAKLLYTNRLFRNEGLDGDQKVAIVENFDRATTVREVKMVYTALVETLGATAKKLRNGNKKTAKVVAEGLASKPLASTASPKTESPEILEENVLAKRLKQLAGIL